MQRLVGVRIVAADPLDKLILSQHHAMMWPTTPEWQRGRRRKPDFLGTGRLAGALRGQDLGFRSSHPILAR